MRNCIACSALTSGLDRRPDVVAIGVLVFGATNPNEDLDSIRNGLCARHDRIFRQGVEDVTAVAQAVEN